MALALPVKASLYSAGSTTPQFKEPRLAACLRNAMSYDAQAELSKVRLAREIVLRYANKCEALSGYLPWASLSSLHVSGKSSHMSTYSLLAIF